MSENGMDALTDKERNIVDLINSLAEAADDETTTQEAIDRIVGKIKTTTAESMSREMPSAIRAETPSMEHVYQTLQPEQPHMIITRTREVKRPEKAHPTDAGIDFFVPDAKAWTDEYKSLVRNYSRNPAEQDLVFIGVNGVEVAPGAHVAIPSGIKTIIPPGLAMLMVNKSGVATKLKLDHSACLIDSEYRDELIFCFFNNNQDRVVIEPGMKITQGLIVPVINLQLQEVLNCVYEDMGRETDRGGGFGSSGSH